MEQDVPNTTASMTYTATVWAKNTAANSSVYFGVKNYGGEEIKQKIDNSSDYKQYELSFTVSGNSKPRVYIWAESLSGGSVYVDDFNMTVNSDFDTLAIENGKLTVTYRENLTEEISKEDFTLNAVSSLDEETIIPLEITEVTKISENKAEIAFNPIEASPVEQTITVDVDYKGQTFVLDCVIDANGEELDKGTISNFTADKISCYAEFETLPTVAPEQSDFTLQRKINDGAFEEVEIKSYSFDRAAKKASFGYSAVPTTDEPQNVTVKLTYDGKDYEASYEVVKGQGTIYYVDSENGNDTNNGTSEGTAFQTIEKINSIEFQPGDQILFKCGGTWTGALMPKGSGEEGNPITIGSYGEGPKPVLMPGEDWTDDSYIPNYINKANTVISNVVTNNVITFYNQEHWVVKDLELYDPRGEAEGFDPSQYYNRKYYYRAILIRLTATSTAGVGGEDTFITAAEIMLYEFVKPETPEVDKTSIEEQLNRYNGLNKADYTEESWNAMEAVLAETKIVFENVAATEEQVAQAAANLRNAIDSLKKVSGYEVGDVDHSGSIDIDDATAIQCHLVKIEPMGTFDESLADVNGDGYITIIDATFIQIMLMSN
ncbi:hypothetical protein B5F08_04650 [Anaeromassilibacillus sp. An172]|uniref:dockerin type I domain-containing protein n=1 Tax=Anaeromassilibacillus sp. An172 TaxID=1965570 RepID=UPI000B37F4D8|nr:dockerin type I domain-containing protein [Anaeromassilibacillus sp. An172]OUP79495.1 hypothetical protein B5F08_04650 [Anaeromassilibacillus sp. An172]